MPARCRHELNHQSSPHNEVKKENVGYTHIVDTNFGPEKHFEPWNLSGLAKNRIIVQNNENLNNKSFSE